jgi:hypothetical protein
MTWKSAMGVLSVIIMVAAYSIYIWQTAKGKSVRPHPFSWWLWGFVTGVAYLVQVNEKAGPGSWVVGFTCLSCVLIGAVSFFRYKWTFSRFDWMSLAVGLAVFVYYLLSKNPLQSAVLATTIDVIGYGPTVRKGWFEPENDSVTSFALNSAKFIPSIFALESYSVATVLYPATLVLMNAGVAAMLVWRRNQPPSPSKSI